MKGRDLFVWTESAELWGANAWVLLNANRVRAAIKYVFNIFDVNCLKDDCEKWIVVDGVQSSILPCPES